MTRRRTSQQGFALIAVLAVLVVLIVLGSLLLYIVAKEVRLGALRKLGAESLYLAEAGGYAARAGLMVLVNEDPIGRVSIDPTLTGTQVAGWYAAGDPNLQNPLALFDYLVLDGQRYNFSPTAETSSLAFEVDWSQPFPHRKLQEATGNPPANALGAGQYRATLVITKRLGPHPTNGVDVRYIQQIGTDDYEFFYSYAIIGDGEVAPQSRRRVILSGDFSLRLQRRCFCEFALFTHVHATPGTGGGPPDGPIWFTSRTSFDGPVHTNGEFRFAFFPKFGRPDPNASCDPVRIIAIPLTSAGCADPDCTNSDRDYAWFNNNGNPVRLREGENVVGTVRRDAPVMPDCTPSNTSDDNDNPPANFSRGVEPIPVPSNSYNQRAISIGRDPADTSPNGWTDDTDCPNCWNQAIRQVIPELTDNATSVPEFIYVPVIDRNSNGRSDNGEALAGGIYVQGNLTSLTLSVAGPTDNLAVYTLCKGGVRPGPACSDASQKVTVTVDRVAQTTTVNNTCWNPPTCDQSGTRTFQGVPKGWQGIPGSENSSVVYVQGNLAGSAPALGLKGTLEEKEQTIIMAAGRIDIVDHLQYEDPPDVANPLDNPLNVLGLFSASNDIRITTAAPDNLTLHAALMAGQPGVADGYNSSVHVQNYNSGPPRGTVQMIGSLVEEYYGAFGTFCPGPNPCGSVQPGDPLTGFGRNFKFDRRLARGIQPPFFPTTDLFQVRSTDQRIAGIRPVWREAAP